MAPKRKRNWTEIRFRIQAVVVVVVGVFAVYVVVDANLPAIKRKWDSFTSGTSAPAGTTSTTSTTVSKSKAAPPSYIVPSQVPNFDGKYETVRFHVANTYTDANGTEFLDQYVSYTSGFVVTIYSSNVYNYPSDPATEFAGKTVDVTGAISYYDDYYEILNPSAIVAVSPQS